MTSYFHFSLLGNLIQAHTVEKSLMIITRPFRNLKRDMNHNQTLSEPKQRYGSLPDPFGTKTEKWIITRLFRNRNRDIIDLNQTLSEPKQRY